MNSKQNSSFIGKYIGDLVYGANDGIITTFAVIAGTTGAGFSPIVTVVLSFANLFADGLSMGVSDFLGIKSEKYYADSIKSKESWEITHDRPHALAEIREVFASRGFKDGDLNRAVEIVSSNKKAWLETMVRDEEGVIDDPRDDPRKHGFATFLAFITFGFIPLLTFLIPLPIDHFIAAAIVGASTLFIVGAMRTYVTAVSWIRGGLEMLIVGSVTGSVAYAVGTIAEKLVK